MKKHLLKTLLMGVMTLIATGAWAADPDLTNDYTLVKSAEWGDGTNIAGSGACAHTAYDTGNKKQQSLTILTAPDAAAGWIAMQAWTNDASGKGWWNRADKGLYCVNAGRSACVFGDDLTTGWLVVFECTTSASSVMTLTNANGEPDGTFSYVASEDGQKYFCTITAAEDAYVGFCGNKNAIGISKISVYKPNKAVVATTYTVNYVDMDGNTLKEPATYNAIGGADIALSDADKANITVGDDTYVYDSDDTEGKTVAEDGSSVVTVKFHKAQNFNYTVNEMCGGTAARVTKSFSYETATVTAPYRKYNAVDGQLYTKGDTSKEYNYKFTLTQDNQVENLDYEAVSGVDNVVFLTEGEDVEGLTPCNSANTGIRSSNSASAYAAADTKIVTLGPGTYKMHAIIYDASKTPDSHWIFKAGETQIADFNCTTVNIQEFDSEEFTLTENADIIMAAAGGNTMGLDALYITGTGSVVTVTSKTIALDPGPWAVDGATFAAYAWNDDGNNWFPFVEVSEGIYGTQIPAIYTKILLARINPSGTDLNPWNNVWNQTDDIDLTTIAEGTLFTITGWGEGEGAKSTYTTTTGSPLDIAKAKLQAAIDAVSAYGFPDLNEYVTAAQAAVNDPDATIESLQAAATKFETAVNAYLKTILTMAVTMAEKMDVAALADVLANAKTVAANDEATTQDLANAMFALLNASQPIVKGMLEDAVGLATLFGVDTTAAQALLAMTDPEATTIEMYPVLDALATACMGPAHQALNTLKSFIATFDGAAEEALADDFAKLEADFTNKDLAAVKADIATLMANGKPYLQTDIAKLEGYVAVLGNETISGDVAAMKAAIEAENFAGLYAALKQFETDLFTAAPGIIEQVKFAAAGYKDAGKTNGMGQLEAAIEAAEAALGAEDKTVVTVGLAVRNLILATQAFYEANKTYTIAGTKDLTGTEEAWQIAEANNMTLDTESSLYTWTAENITVTAEAQPQFKVVITDIDGKQTWVPASEDGDDHNWVITPDVVGGEGVYNITITYNVKTQEIGVTGVKAETDDAIYSIYYSAYTGFPFYVMGYVPEFSGDVMTDYGAMYGYKTDAEMESGDFTEVGTVTTQSGNTYHKVSLAEAGWHQYFIADNIPTESNGNYTVKAMVKASEPVTFNVNMGWGWGEGQQMGTSVAIGTEWQEVEWKYEAIGGTSCNLVAQPGTSAATIEWKYVKVYYTGQAVEPEWTDIIVNGDMEGESAECFYVTEQGIGGPFIAPITEGIGKDGSKAVKVESYYDPAQDWDSQFFIRLPYQVPAGTKFKVSFDYKADKAGDFDTQSHTEPGGYIHWACIGSGSFTDSWKTFEAEGIVSADMSKEGQLFQTIAFNLAKNKVATQFIFDNVKFEVPTDALSSLILNPAQNPQPYTKPVFDSMAIVGDFLGLSTEENPNADWDPANGWQMTKDAENEAVWTVVVDEFTAEAKTYEYKAVANGNWDDYVLPADKNADYNFDTANLGAGKYKLTFTVDTRKHSVNLDVEKLDVTTYTATFTTDAEWEEVYAYAWSGTEGQEGFKKFLGDWPGTKLEAVEGVYTVSIESTDAPEKIIFNNGNSGEGNQTGDLEFANGGAYEYKKPTGEEAPVKLAPEGWTLATTNGNLAGDDASSYVMKEYPSTDIVPAAIEAGAGTEGSRGIVVRAGDDTANDSYAAWDSQFWIQLAEAVPAGTKVHVEFDYKASQAAKATTQAHNTPGAYQHWAAIGDVNFTTEWQTFSADIEVDDAMAGTKTEDGVTTVGPGLLTIAFNLQEEKSATNYYFDNFGVWYQKPVTIESMAIVGDFLGLEGDANWDPANGWEMEQDAENPAVWTLTKDFTAESKTYEYKATANGKWGDYELPAEGNQNFVFGTDEYPAGDYKLVFTADTEKNTLDLVVKPSSVQTFTATFTTNAYWWENVYAYAYTEDGENVKEYLGEWPGTLLKADADGVYTVNVEGEVAPAMIVFNNGLAGEGNQTEDLAFEEGKAYKYVFNPTFDFENNNGNWAEGATFENGFTLDEVTLTGIKNVKYTSGQLRIGNRTGSFKLSAPEGRNIEKIELKVLKADAINLTPSTGEVANTKTLTQGEEENQTVIYSIWTWTGSETEVSFDLSGAMQRNLGFINVTLDSGTTTGISTMAIDTKNTVIYNLSGQKVTKTQKGLYIVNGKKVVVK